MIVECQSCHTKFELDPSQVRKGGSQVRCSKCKSLFFVKKPGNFRPTPSTSSLNSSRRKQRKYWWVIFLVTVILGSGLGLFIAYEKRVLVFEYLKSLAYRDYDPGNRKMTLSDVKGFFEENNHAGKMFIIKGIAINGYDKTRSFIKIKAKLFNSEGSPVMEKEVICGNTVSDHELKVLPLQDIYSKLSVNDKTVVNTSPQQSTPFALVFHNLPKDLAEFGVEVLSSQPEVEIKENDH